MIDDNDLKLIEEAKQVINKNFDEVDENHTVGAALRCKNGNIYVGVNVYAVHGSCAEYIAIGTAITAGEREFDTIVAVRSPEKNNTLISPCGNCRQMLMQYAPDIKVLIQTEDGIQKVCIKELLPYSPY
ncbi:cytidine deaminase [Clostridium pascui]|uniref:cytidine deaminase n=1 Tax=Clostridium pascui TaxID=46609 RepID=UPI00195DA02B|nr:cytidine deaminase [Clostridium pascui]MBM7871397.1 cytidine deaminase [Clostridium pascui]